LVELGTAGLFALLWYQYGPSVLLVLFSIYSALLVLIGIVDFEQRRIPNKLVYPGWILAVAGSLVSPSESFWLRAILGGVAGFVILYLIHLGSKVFLRMAKFQGKPDGPAEFGLGDVPLGALIGLMLGVPWVFTALLLGVLLGGIAALLFWFFRAVIRRDYVPLTVMAYGPWLAGGALLTILFQPVVHLPGLQG
jgi:leader peptidase (prepilin peptidase)/N-methyltransferase